MKNNIVEIAAIIFVVYLVVNIGYDFYVNQNLPTLTST